MTADTKELKNTTYEAFIAILSVLSIVNIFLIYIAASEDVAHVVMIIDGVLSGIFFVDFTYLLATSENRGRYFFREFGWADLVSSIPLPLLKILRVFRIWRAYQLGRKYGAGRMLRTFWKERAQSALLVVGLLIIVLLEFGSMAVVFFEEDASGANITTGGDAIWWAFVTITTVGYGDKFPVTTGGRVVGVLVMAGGVALFGTLTGYLANLFLAPHERGSDAGSARKCEGLARGDTQGTRGSGEGDFTATREVGRDRAVALANLEANRSLGCAGRVALSNRASRAIKRKTSAAVVIPPTHDLRAPSHRETTRGRSLTSGFVEQLLSGRSSPRYESPDFEARTIRLLVGAGLKVSL